MLSSVRFAPGAGGATATRGRTTRGTTPSWPAATPADPGAQQVSAAPKPVAPPDPDRLIQVGSKQMTAAEVLAACRQITVPDGRYQGRNLVALVEEFDLMVLDAIVDETADGRLKSACRALYGALRATGDPADPPASAPAQAEPAPAPTAPAPAPAAPPSAPAARAEKPAPAAAPAAAGRKGLLPTEPTPPKRDLRDFTILLYGPPKIGKTSFIAQMEHPLFLATESGLNGVEAFQTPVPDWETFLAVCGEIAEGKHGFRTICIDTVTNLWKFCSAYQRKKLGIQHESDLDWGKGWELVKGEFMRALVKLSLLPYGLVMIAHDDVKEIKSRTGTISRTTPDLATGAREVIIPMVDFELYMHAEQRTDGPVRVIHSLPSENWEAGTRVHGFPAEIVMTLDRPEVDAAVFRKAFEEAIRGA